MSTWVLSKKNKHWNGLHHAKRSIKALGVVLHVQKELDFIGHISKLTHTYPSVCMTETKAFQDILQGLFQKSICEAEIDLFGLILWISGPF